MQNSEFAYFSSKSGKHMKQMFNPPFWREKSGLRFWFGALEVPFLGAWTWAFLAKIVKSAHVQFFGRFESFFFEHGPKNWPELCGVNLRASD